MAREKENRKFNSEISPISPRPLIGEGDPHIDHRCVCARPGELRCARWEVSLSSSTNYPCVSFCTFFTHRLASQRLAFGGGRLHCQASASDPPRLAHAPTSRDFSRYGDTSGCHLKSPSRRHIARRPTNISH